MDLVVDSHALFWYLSDNPKLSSRARKHLEDATRVIVPSIASLEILFLLRKHRAPALFLDFLAELKTRNYTVYPLDVDVIAQISTLPHDLEIHDSIIIATSQLLDAPLVTKDSLVKKLYANTLW